MARDQDPRGSQGTEPGAGRRRLFTMEEVFEGGSVADLPPPQMDPESGARVCDVCGAGQQLPTTKHCLLCDRCVLGWDHHCWWVGNCVGQANHRWFWSYLLFQVRPSEGKSGEVLLYHCTSEGYITYAAFVTLPLCPLIVTNTGRLLLRRWRSTW